MSTGERLRTATDLIHVLRRYLSINSIRFSYKKITVKDVHYRGRILLITSSELPIVNIKGHCVSLIEKEGETTKVEADPRW